MAAQLTKLYGNFQILYKSFRKIICTNFHIWALGTINWSLRIWWYDLNPFESSTCLTFYLQRSNSFCSSSFKEEKRVTKDVDMDLITNFRQRDWMVTWGHQQFTICTRQKSQDAPLIILISRYTKFIRFLKIQYSNA